MDEEKLLLTLRSHRRYGELDPGLLLRLAQSMAPRYPKEKDALDAIKRHLHIITGMYQNQREQKHAASLLGKAVLQPPTPDSVRQTAQELMALHASTRERLAVLPRFYAVIFEALPKVRSILDLGCGFQPFARPWMPDQADCVYHALDLSGETAELLNLFFAWSGLGGEAGVLDLLSRVPEHTADLALLMKLLPVLEQQRKGAGVELLGQLKARFAAVTFPIRSMGGRQRGMAVSYGAWMHQHLPSQWKVMQKQEIGNELLYIIQNRTEEETS